MTGNYSPAIVSIALFLLVGLFDVVLELLPNPIASPLNHGVPTIITGLIMIAMLLWEVTK